MLTIWGRRNSINVQKAMWTLGELGLAHRHVDAGMQFGRNKDADFLAKNPNGLVPLLEDGDFTLWESNVIVRYLAAAHGAGTLWPIDAKARADADRWMEWNTTTLMAAQNPVFLGLYRTPPEQRDMAAIEASRAKAERAWRIVDSLLAARAYVGGDRFSMGDIPLGASAYRWHAMAIERPSLPHVEAWYRRLQERPAYRQHVMIPLS